MPRYNHIYNNGELNIVQFTAEEETARDAEEKIWSDAKTTRQLSEIRRIRNEKLSETDYLAMSDNTMSDEIKAFRKSMRDIPQDYTASDYDALLEMEGEIPNRKLKHTVWSKP